MQPEHHHTPHTSRPHAQHQRLLSSGKGSAHILFAALLLKSSPLGKLRAVGLPSGHGQSRGEGATSEAGTTRRASEAKLLK